MAPHSAHNQSARSLSSQQQQHEAATSGVYTTPQPPTKKSSKLKRLFRRTKKSHNNHNHNLGASVVVPDHTILSVNALAVHDKDDSLPHPKYNNNNNNTLSTTTSQQQHTLEEIVQLLQTDIEIRTRKYHLKTYKSCFVASEVIDYLMDVQLVTNRGEGVQLMNDIMLKFSAVQHVTNEYEEFKDEYLFYHFITTNQEDEAEKESSRNVPNYKKLNSSGGGSSHKDGSNKGGGKIVKMDKYGFLLDDDRALSEQDADTNSSTNNPSSKMDTAKRWQNILDKAVPSSSSSSNNKSNVVNPLSVQSKVKAYTRKGLPDGLRQKAWTVLTGVDIILVENPNTYGELVNKADVEYKKMHDHESADVSLHSLSPGVDNKMTPEEIEQAEKASAKIINVLDTIERDIHRTFPKHYLFHTTTEEDEEEDKKEEEERSTEETKSSSTSGDPSNEVLDDSDKLATSSSFNDSENISDDEEEETAGDSTTTDADVDDIVDYAESIGQDPKLVIEAKKRMFNESMNTVMANMSCGVLQQPTAVPTKNSDGGSTPLQALRNSGSGKSDGSLDIFDEEEDDELTELGGSPPRRTMSSGISSSNSITSEALGLGEGQGALRRVLRAYSMYDTDVGYCQGMNFIAAMFLTFLSEEEAFWLLVVVMNEEPYKLRELFGEDMAGTHEVLYIAEKLMAQFLPKLSKHMEAESIHVSMFVTQWLLTVYTSTFPFDLVARVWDCFLVEGWKVVYRVMLSLLAEASKDILDMPFELILGYFRDFPSKVDGQAILAGSLKINLKRKHIQKHVNEWRRHAGGGEERSSKSKSGFRRRHSGDSSVSSATLNSLQTPFPKLATPGFLKNKQGIPKEIEIENLSEQLLPIIGSYKFAVMLHNVVSPEECSELIDRAEEDGFEDASIYDRRTNRAHRNCTRYVFDDASLADNWFERITYALKDTPFERRLMNAPWVDTRNTGRVQHAVTLNERLRLLRYKQGQFFHSHNDAIFVRGKEQGERAGEKSYVSVQVYLNQKFKGGNTTFHGRGRHLDVKPRTGSILIFEHGILHEGQKVTQGKKYLLRTDVMYSSSANVGFTSDVSGTTLTQQL